MAIDHLRHQYWVAVIASLASFAGCDFWSPSPSTVVPIVEPPAIPPIRALPPQTISGLNLDRSQLHDNESAAFDSDWIDTAAINPDRIVFTDNFSDLHGYVHQLINGKSVFRGYGNRSRAIAAFAAPDPDGDFSLQISEDTRSLGPDGQPGVLAIAWNTIPRKLDYSAFVYAGRINGRAFHFDQIIAAKTQADLMGIKLRFKFKGVNTQSPAPVKFSFDIRASLEGEHAFENRLELGRLTASSEWKNHQVDLGTRKNVDLFLASLDRRRNNQQSLIVSQVGSIDNYRAGDILLIDDIEVIVPEQDSKQ